MIPALPQLLVDSLLRQYGQALTEEIMAGYVRKPVTFRVNPLRSRRGDVERLLTDKGIAFEPVPWYEDAYLLPEAREDALRSLSLYQEGGIYLQSLSSMIPPLLMNPQPRQSILDMAAAPGGKTTQLAALSGGKAFLTACEKNKLRAERMQYNLDKQGAANVNVMVTDSRQLDDAFRFDSILLDAPCSGAGTLLLAEGEAPRRMTADWLQKTVRTQQNLLKKALTLLSAGQCMVYSTCSILEEENEGVLRAVLPSFKAEIVPIAHPLMDSVPQLPVTLPGVLCVKPDARHEGFFAAIIRKKK